jgi:uncharacterized protein (DUF2267 family)
VLESIGFFIIKVIMEFKKFRSTKGTIFVTSTSGHAATLTEKEFKSIPEILWGPAYSYGAVSEDMILPKEAMDKFVEERKQELEESSQKERQEMKDALREVFQNPQGNVDKEGMIKYQVAIKVLKKAVKKEVIAELWNELAEEI